MRAPGRKRLSVSFVTMALLAAFVAITTPAATAAPSSSKASWSACFQKVGPAYQCATVHVPLDYDHPGTGTVSIAMVRLRATDPAHRIGSLFVNPGGPGGSGVDFVVFAGPFLFTPEVRARFDIVGFDPRGIIRSTAFRCFGTPKQWAPVFAPFAFPITDEEEAIWEAGEHYLDAACDQRGGKIGDHMATANVARDLDRLRQAVGDSKLSYYGVSYGSYLGQTYANLFPNNFRALVIDGVLDPIAWSTGAPGQQDLPFSTRLRSDAASQAELNEFFRLCDAGGPNCAFSGNSADRFAALADRLRTAPILVIDPNTGETFPFTYQDLIGTALGAMYDSFSWPDFANLLAFMESQASPSTLGKSLGKLWRSEGYIAKRGFPHYANFLEGFPAVACSDSDNPGSYSDWSKAAVDADAFGYFGRIWTWISSICADWPKSDADRYMGPFDHATDASVLVVGNLFDGVTGYHGAQTAHALLSNSALLTVHGWGHTSLFLSACADQAIGIYLVDVVTPAEGTVCEQDVVPFAQPANAAAAKAGSAQKVAARHMVRSVVLPPAVVPRVR
jgi:pimeloyl-ACP methyl ester carboxylesterase